MSIQSPFSTYQGTVRVGDIPGIMTVKDIGATAVVPTFATGVASGVSLSGNTIVSPIASSVIKVYGFCLNTTAKLSNITVNFTNGAGTAPTKFFDTALNDSVQIAVTPPGYLFATASGSTLALLLSNAAGPTHYSVYYFRETA